MGLTMPYHPNGTICTVAVGTIDQCALDEEPENMCRSICNKCGSSSNMPILAGLIICIAVAIDILYRCAKYSVEKMNSRDKNVGQDQGRFAEVVAVLFDHDTRTQLQSSEPIAVGIRISGSEIDDNNVNIRFEDCPIAAATLLNETGS